MSQFHNGTLLGAVGHPARGRLWTQHIRSIAGLEGARTFHEVGRCWYRTVCTAGRGDLWLTFQKKEGKETRFAFFFPMFFCNRTKRPKRR
jgi:hypothetical protein